jgi:hypothetical protein
MSGVFLVGRTLAHILGGGCSMSRLLRTGEFFVYDAIVIDGLLDVGSEHVRLRVKRAGHRKSRGSAMMASKIDGFV